MKARIAGCLVALFFFSSNSFSQQKFHKSLPWSQAIAAGASAEIKTITIRDGLRLEYAEKGDETGVPVIFLHGFTDSWHSFEAVLSFLPECIHAFALSQRGHGNSDKTARTYLPVDFAEDVADFIKRMGIGPAIIVGHSMGGVIAQRFAMDYPELTKGVVIISSAASFQTAPGIDQFVEVVSQLSDPIAPAFAAEFQLSTLAKPIDPVYYDTLVAESLKVPARVWKAVLEGLMKTNFSKELYKIKKPAIVFWGDKDSYCLEKDQEILIKNIPNAQFMRYRQVGHALHWEEPRRFANDLYEFISKSVDRK